MNEPAAPITSASVPKSMIGARDASSALGVEAASLRQEIGQQASRQPIAHLASTFGVGPRFVQGSLETVASTQLDKRGVSVDENQPLPTPRFLGSDEVARRKGHR